MERSNRTSSLLACLALYAAAALAAALVVRFGSRLPRLDALPARPLLLALAADLAATLVVFIGSLALDNSSLYDPYWSVAPPLLALYWLGAYGGWAAVDLRLSLALALMLAWALRLTWNWLRRWRGLGDEDWRYRAFRDRFGPWYWPVSFAGIHLFPTLVVFLGCLPVHELVRAIARGTAPAPAAVLTVAAAIVTAGAIAIETVADEQLRRFRTRPEAGGGVLSQGLWALCRHPNYVGEVLFWWGLYLFCLAAAPGAWWTVIGPLAMTVMFLTVSVPMMDRRLAARRRVRRHPVP